MIVRLGYVAMTLYLEDCSPSGTVTVATLNKLDGEGKLRKIRAVTKKNLINTHRILLYNKAIDAYVYRFTSKLVPLATHPELDGWDYGAEFKEEFEKIGALVKENDFRVSAHPDHFTLINSPKPEVNESAIKDLIYHVNLFEAMGLEDYKYKLVMHIGGLYKDKKSSIERFKDSFIRLPDKIRNRLMLENDDKSFTAKDVLGICQELKTPMVLDVHHHNCNNEGEDLKDMLGDIFDTWNGHQFPPKIHFSSPKNEKDFRSHHDYITPESFVEFLKTAKELDRDIDVMLEAKQKDLAFVKLSEEISKVDWIKKLNQGTFQI